MSLSAEGGQKEMVNHRSLKFLFFFFLVNASLFVFVYYRKEVINPDNETMQDSGKRGT